MRFDGFKKFLPAFSAQQKKSLSLLGTLLTGCVLLAPYIHFQGYLSQGDHGRELYCAEQVLRGAVPYRDFFWNYGPLPLYFYALCFKLFGVSINSVLAGRALLNLLSGFFIFRSLGLFIPLRFACLAAVWFWFFNPDFHFTYCYTGGITVLLALAYALFLYVMAPRFLYLAGALLCVFLLGLIKINFGITSLAAVLLSVFLMDLARRKRFSTAKGIFYAIAGLGLPLVVLLVYISFLYTLQVYEIYQCFPFLPNRPVETVSTFGFSSPVAFSWWLRAQLLTVVQSWYNLIMAFLLMLSVGLTVTWWLKKETGPSKRQQSLMAFLILLFCYFLTLLEFLISGIPYRAAWSYPFGLLIFFLFWGLGFRQIRLSVQTLLILALCFKVFTQHAVYLKQMKVFKNSGKFFAAERGQLIVANSPSWIRTVLGATRYLEDHLSQGETFYALPYDPLYYFLTQKTAPTRQYMLYAFYGRIPSHQEGQIISDLNAKKANYILISNRQKSTEGLGTFGTDYCPLLFRYINQNFREVATFGPWDAPAGWVDGHAVKILKRVSK